MHDSSLSDSKVSTSCFDDELSIAKQLFVCVCVPASA